MGISLRKGHFYLVLAAISLTSFYSCDQKAEVPSYITIDKVGFTSDYPTEGTSSSNITDAWVYLDSKMIGVFELPAKFPVLADGEHIIDVSPGIKVSGVSESRSPYPFYRIYSGKVMLTRGEISHVDPAVTYAPFAKFPWMEDFENPGVSISKTATSDVPLTVVSASGDAFEGQKCGFASLNYPQGFSRLDFRTDNAYALPTGGSNVFLEMNYKISQTLVVGIVSNTSSGSTPISAIFLKSTADDAGHLQWKKIYINLTSVISPETGARDFNIFFHSETDEQVPNPVYYIDNIKLVY